MSELTFKGESGFGFQYIIPPLKCEASEQGSRVNATSKISGKKSDSDMAMFLMYFLKIEQ